MSEVTLTTSGPPETVLDPEPAEALAALAAALELSGDARRDAIAASLADFPRFLDGWARLGDAGRDPVERYAAYRVGYHRGLDRLRANGWRGSGYVRWVHEPNRGFLRALHALGSAAATIGETEEAARCQQFLADSSPAAVAALG